MRRFGTVIVAAVALAVGAAAGWLAAVLGGSVNVKMWKCGRGCTALRPLATASRLAFLYAISENVRDPLITDGALGWA